MILKAKLLPLAFASIVTRLPAWKERRGTYLAKTTRLSTSHARKTVKPQDLDQGFAALTLVVDLRQRPAASAFPDLASGPGAPLPSPTGANSNTKPLREGVLNHGAGSAVADRAGTERINAVEKTWVGDRHPFASCFLLLASCYRCWEKHVWSYGPLVRPGHRLARTGSRFQTDRGTPPQASAGLVTLAPD